MIFHVYSCDICLNKQLEVYNSPDKRYKTIVFSRNCGATTGISTQISLLNVNEELPNDGGNLFICDDPNGNVKLGSWGGPIVIIEWLSPKKLKISYDKDARIYFARDLVRDVVILYEEFD